MRNKKFICTLITANFFLLINGIFSGCKKNETGSSVPINITLPKDGLAYIQIEAGKYFIYKDSATNKLDSVVVTKTLLESFTETFFDVVYNSERYTLILSKIDSSGNTIEWLSGKAEADVESKDTYMTRNPGQSFTDGYYFRYPPCNCGNENNIPTMVVEGKTYTDVVLTASTNTYIYSYYWAKGVGLIKSSVTDASGTKTYMLLRSN